MNSRVIEGKNALRNSLILFLVILMCVVMLGSVVRADSGPKAAVNITIQNPPSGTYYVALLENRDSRPADNDRPAAGVAEEDYWISDMLYEYEEDGFYMYFYGGGASSLTSSEKMGVPNFVNYHYMVPSTFKVVIVTPDGNMKVSNAVTRKAFDAEFIYDYAENTLTEVNVYNNYIPRLITESAIYFVITLIVEGLLLLCFGLFRLKNLIPFVMINVITQALLFGFNAGARYWEPVFPYYFWMWIGMEFIILVIELLWYRNRLKNKKDKVSALRNTLYCITANVVSACIDIPVLIIVTSMHLYNPWWFRL